MNYKKAIRNTLKTIYCLIINKPTPFVINVEITKKCNSRCNYCDFWKTNGDTLDFETYKKIIDEADDLGVTAVTLTGGEPLLHKDIIKILKYTHDKGLFVILLTNGFILKHKINQIKEHVDLFTISLDTLKEELYDEIRGIKGGFKMCMEGINSVINEKKPLELTCVISEKNYKEINNIINFAIKNKLLVGFNPVHYSKNGKIIIGTKNPKIRNAYKTILELKKQGKPISNSTRFIESLANNKKIKCNRLNISIEVNEKGNALIDCPYINENTNQKYNIKNKTLKELYYGSQARKARKFAKTCTLCKHACMMETSLLANRDVKTINEYLITGIKTLLKNKQSRKAFIKQK